MREAVSDGRVVIACAYRGKIPERLRSQLFSRGDSAFVARIVDGRITQIVPGLPERAVQELLRASPETATAAPGPVSCDAGRASLLP